MPDKPTKFILKSGNPVDDMEDIERLLHPLTSNLVIESCNVKSNWVAQVRTLSLLGVEFEHYFLVVFNGAGEFTNAFELEYEDVPALGYHTIDTDDPETLLAFVK